MSAVAKRSNTRPRAAILFNPKKSGMDDVKRSVQNAERRHGWSESLWIASRTTDAPIQQALAENVDLVVVFGGDGTVRRAIAQMVDVDVPLGIVPSGTGNLLARQLSLPLGNVDAALDIAFGSSEQLLDVIHLVTENANGKLRREVSVVLSGVGIDAAMIANTSAALKKRLGWVAYVDGIRRSLGQIEPFMVRVSIDGGPTRSHRAAAVFIANLAELPGNVSLVPGAAIDDGQLDVIVLQPRHILDWLFIWRRFSWENAILRRTELGAQFAEAFKGRNRRQLAYRRGTHVRVTIEGSPQPFQIDGDSAGVVRTVSAQVNPHGMRIRVPQH